jgi:hypothetical protein
LESQQPALCCVFISHVCPQGIQDMLLQYLQLVMGFNSHDQAVLITVIGTGNFTVQVGGSTCDCAVLRAEQQLACSRRGCVPTECCLS